MRTLSALAVLLLAAAGLSLAAGPVAAAGTGAVSVTVSVSVAGKVKPAPAGIVVSLDGYSLPGQFEAVTDSAGKVKFPSVPAGDYLMVFEDTTGTYVTVWLGGEQSGNGRVLKVTEGATAAVSQTMPRAGVLTGTVLDSAGRAPVETLVILTSSLSGSAEPAATAWEAQSWASSSTGKFTFTAIPGTYRIYFSAFRESGLTPRYKTGTFTIKEAATTTVSTTTLASAPAGTWSPATAVPGSVAVGASAVLPERTASGGWAKWDARYQSTCRVESGSVVGVTAGTCTLTGWQTSGAAGLRTYKVTVTGTASASFTVNGAVPVSVKAGATVSVPTKTTTGAALTWTATTPATCTMTSSKTFVRGVAKGACKLSVTAAGFSGSKAYSLSVS